jgi:formylglycine-generating enzyme
VATVALPPNGVVLARRLTTAMAVPQRQPANPPDAAFIEPRMAAIPAGWFSMGCDSGRDDEKPVHRVWVDSFEIAACQVKRGEYEPFLAATGRPAPPFWNEPQFQNPEQPVVGTSWHDAVSFCDWLGRLSGCRYRLPTEAEWERAARGGVEGAPYAWGDAAPETLPNYAARWREGPEPAGLYAPNAYGLFNMGDNIHEWCADWYDPRYYEHSPARNPTGPGPGGRKASRGGSWRHHIKVSRCAARSSIPPEFKYADYGFRVAR